MDKLGLYSIGKISSLIALTPVAILGGLDIALKFQYLIAPRGGTEGIDTIRDAMLITGIYALYLTTSTLERNEILERYGTTNIQINHSTNLPAKTKSKVTIDDFVDEDEKSFDELGEDDESFQERENRYLEILSRTPKDRRALKKLANLYYDGGRYEDSLKRLMTLREIYPEDPTIWTKIGDNFKALGQTDDMQKAYKKAKE